MKKIILKGWIARDKAFQLTYDTQFFPENKNKKPPQSMEVQKGQVWTGGVRHLPDLMKLKKGECRKVTITITEYK